MDFPKIPSIKTYNNSDSTEENNALMSALQSSKISKKEEKILRESRDFYLKAFKFLKKINLSKINERDASEIKNYLKAVFRFQGIIHNDLTFKFLYRITLVKDSFLEENKVRNPKYISYPPLEVIRQNGIYGRANTPNSTVLYCSFHPNIALSEIKPSIGDRIIITEWFKEDDEPFNSYPIINNEIKENLGLTKASHAFEKVLNGQNQYFKRIFQLYFEFIGSEFVKNIPVTHRNKYEYLYSAFFSDIVLQNNLGERTPFPNFDCIIYPSIASKYQTDNIAIHPNSVRRLRPCFMEDCIVIDTDYTRDLISKSSIIKRKVLRTSDVIIDDKIIWSDD